MLGFIFGRKSVLAVRKGYDRVREKADAEKNVDKRLSVLRILDEAEPFLVSLEEHFVSNYEKKRMLFRIEENIKRARFLLNDKESMKPMIGGHEENQKAR